MREAIREAVLGVLVPAWQGVYPSVPLVHDNQAFELNELIHNYAMIEFRFFDGRQIGAAAAPKTRFSGYVYASVRVREGDGTIAAYRQLKLIEDTLKYRSLGPVRLQAPEPDGDETVRGFHCVDSKIAFYADET